MTHVFINNDSNNTAWLCFLLRKYLCQSNLSQVTPIEVAIDLPCLEMSFLTCLVSMFVSLPVAWASVPSKGTVNSQLLCFYLCHTLFLELSSVCVCSEGYCWMLISSRQCMESMWPWCHTGEPTRPPRRPGRQAAVPTCCGESQGPETSDLHRLFPPHCGWAPPVRQGLMQAMQKLPCLQVSWGHQALLKPLTVDRQHPL